jgi:hypothetical protein
LFSPRELPPVIVGFALMTLVLTYPQVQHLSTGVSPLYDSLFNTWRVAWIAHQLPRNPLHLFDANIFYPQPGTLTYSDALLLPALLGAPLIWAGMHAILVQNLLLLLSFVACGVSMYLLVRAETSSVPAAWFAGVVFAFQPYRFAHYAHLELLWGWPIPLAFWALRRLLTSARVRDGVLLGLAVVVQTLSCLYYAVFLATALAVLAAVELTGRSWAAWRALVRPALAAALVCLAVVGPYSMPYRAESRPLAARSAEEVRAWSPPLRSYLTTPDRHWLYGDRLTWSFGETEQVMFPGVIAVCAAVLGAASGIANRRRGQLCYAVLLAVAVDMSLGFNGLTYRAFYGLMWPFHHLRVPARMFVIVSAALAVLGGYGVKWLMDAIGRPWSRLVAGLLVAMVLLESASVPIALTLVPPTPPAVYRWLRLQPPAVVLEWPLPDPASLGVTETPLFMYYSTFHWQKLVDGYSGYYPPSYIELLVALSKFPDSTSVRFLQRSDVRFVILHSFADPERYTIVKDRVAMRPELRPILSTQDDQGETSVYEVIR